MINLYSNALYGEEELDTNMLFLFYIELRR